jgi:hypothetical protein
MLLVKEKVAGDMTQVVADLPNSAKPWVQTPVPSKKRKDLNCLELNYSSLIANNPSQICFMDLYFYFDNAFDNDNW